MVNGESLRGDGRKVRFQDRCAARAVIPSVSEESGRWAVHDMSISTRYIAVPPFPQIPPTVGMTSLVTSPSFGAQHRSHCAVQLNGGLALVAGFVITFSLLCTGDAVDQRALAILTGGLMMLLLGLYDDLAGFSPAVKFLGQFVAVAALCKAGVCFQFPVLGEWGNIALTFLWVTG